ncbi:acyl-CoA N-acyltransferase [Corynascus similis CBS 632.67]
MAGAEKGRPEEESPCPTQEEDQAVDESSDVDGDFASLQEMLCQKRRAAKDSPEFRLQKALPFISTFTPNIRPLTINDLPSCIELENASFPNPEHRASPDKIAYRLTICPELSLGVFLTVIPDRAANLGLETLSSARVVETGRVDGAVSVLLAHVISTRCRGNAITDADMAYPKEWRSPAGRGTDQTVGHHEAGRTVGLHSLAVLPRLQRCGIGQMIIKAFLDQMKNCGVVDRVALICQDHLVSYYERLGFKHLGPSKVQFGGGGWHDMVHDLPHPNKTPVS